MIEVLAGAERVPQPQPAKNGGGDCFACATLAMMRHLFPEDPPSFDQVWNWWVHTNPDDSRHLSNTWGQADAVAAHARVDGYPLEFTYDRVMPSELRTSVWSYAFPLEISTADYARRLEGYLRGGWLALTEIDADGRGPYSPSGQRHSINHFVLLDGIRSGWSEPRDLESGGTSRSLQHHVHVVDSSRAAPEGGAYWREIRRWLISHGGAGWALFRRDEL